MKSIQARLLAGAFATMLLLGCPIAARAAAAPSSQSPPAAATPGAIDWNKLDSEALEYFRTYLRFDTTNPPSNTAAAIAYLKGILDREGIENATFESKPGMVTLVARLPGPAGLKPFLLLSHADVVPAVASTWSHPPFSADLAGGYVWARGAIDNKAHGIMALMTMLALKREQLPLKRGVVMMVNPDEEAGGEFGAAWMAKNHWDAFDPAFAVNEGGSASPDPFGEASVAFNVAVAEKAALWLRLTAHGHSGHGSTPIADNPNLILINALHRLLENPPAMRLTPMMAEAMAAFAARTAFPASFELAHLDWPFMLEVAARGPLSPYYLQALFRDTISPTMLNAGFKVNVIPSTAEASLDCRLLPGTDSNAFLGWVRDLLADSRISIDVIQRPEETAPSPTSGEAWDALTKVVGGDFKDVFVVPWMTAGATDSRFLRQHGVPAYGFVPIVLDRNELARVHGVDERLSVENLDRGIKATYDLTADLCVARNDGGK
ncbi:MAG TPA: M20/M25/M40 family metallo-hydrolase [Candidatus Binataceae bacterium]|nr:M20/M25/M40 family metallo-hydrolase [Candidatus Binataceae bacterium]